MQYKTVAGPIGLMIKKNDSYEEAVKQYAAIIDREAVGGWELLFIQEIPVTKDKGCMAGCLSMFGLASQYEQISFNMLVFGKKD
ncbi:MAG: hypothetical protein IKK66_09000 [Ruminococcus sp.]|nr:hypothetical protein [Ruminococcus sp.]